MLSPNLIEKQKNILLAEKGRLETKISGLNKFPDYGQSEDDNAKEMADFGNNQSVEEQLVFLLNKIKYALESIENKTYGKCGKCKKMIEEGRLEIMPYAELCVTCRKSNDK